MVKVHREWEMSGEESGRRTAREVFVVESKLWSVRAAALPPSDNGETSWTGTRLERFGKAQCVLLLA